MKKMIFTTCLTALAATALVLAAPDKTAAETLPTADTIAETALKNAEKEGLKPGSDWTVAVYLCGTNLETGGAAASDDLCEMLNADIPDNVNVLVMTGGTEEWQDQETDGYVKPSNDYTQIWQLTDERMVKLYQYDRFCNLSDADTLKNFLQFSIAYAPASHMMVDLWDHGNGPIDGAISAENPGEDETDSIPTNNIEEALEAANRFRKERTGSSDNIDIAAFDCCLMGNVEIAYALSDAADFLVASEETEPSTGWNYRFLSIFSEEGFSSLSSRDQSIAIGKRVVDLYPGNDDPAEAEEFWTGGAVYELTMALVDLKQMEPVADAVEKLSKVLLRIYQDPEKYVKIVRATSDMEGLGLGYMGLIDVHAFADILVEANISGDLTAAAKALIQAVGQAPKAESEKGQLGSSLSQDSAVLYRGLTPEYAGGIGLSIFYPGAPDTDSDFLKETEEAGTYQGLSFIKKAPGYGSYVSELAKREDKKDFGGKVTADWDPETSTIYMEVKKGKPNRIATVLTEISATEGDREYLLGSMRADYNETYGRYEVPEMQRWLSFDGVPFSYDTVYVNGVRMYEIPVYEEKGEADRYKEGDTVPENEIIRLLVVDENNTLRIYGIFSQKEDRTRVLSPEETITFHPLRFMLADDGGVYVANKTVTVAPETPDGREDNTPVHLLHAEKRQPSTDADYMLGFTFKAYDWNYKAYYSDPLYIGELNVEKLAMNPIWAMPYTGEPVCPKLSFSCGDINDMDIETVEYYFGLTSDTEYKDNIERGTAHVTTTFRDRLSGEVVSSMSQDFLIVADEDAVVTTEEKTVDGKTVTVEKGTYADGSGYVRETTHPEDGVSSSLTTLMTGDSKVTKILDEYQETSGAYTTVEYDMDFEDTLVVSHVSSNTKTALICSSITAGDGKTYPVEMIAAGAFSDAGSVKKIIITGKISIIEKKAFSGLSKKLTFEIKAKKKAYKKMVKKIKKAGVPKKTRFHRIK